MIPPFQNPHSQHTKCTTRAHVLPFHAEEDNDNDDGETGGGDHLALLRRLDELVRGSLGDFHLPGVQAAGPKRKHRKIGNEHQSGSDVQDSLPFRLVSNTIPPDTISLLPKPPPQSRTREPACEDNEDEAEERMKRAKSIAVDCEWVLRESKNPQLSWRNLRQTTATFVLPELFDFPTAAPPMLLTPRFPMTRPTIPSHLKYPSCPAPSYDRKARCYFRLWPSPVATSTSVKRKRKRKKSGRGPKERRVLPTFWSPSPSLGGKSAGYALGYHNNRT